MAKGRTKGPLSEQATCLLNAGTCSGYIGIMEKNMETTILQYGIYSGDTGIMCFGA